MNAKILQTRTENDRAQLVGIAEQAARDYFQNILGEHPLETFYYFALVTTVNVNWVAASAWSKEALETEAQKQTCDPDELRWSYADSPYCSHNQSGIGMGTLDKAFQRRVDMHDLQDEGRDSEWDVEFKLRTDVLVSAMQTLNRENTFANSDAHHEVILLVDVYDTCFDKYSARKLNPQRNFEWWLSSGPSTDCECQW